MSEHAELADLAERGHDGLGLSRARREGEGGGEERGMAGQGGR
jgi:hypothetical protein